MTERRRHSLTSRNLSLFREFADNGAIVSAIKQYYLVRGLNLGPIHELVLPRLEDEELRLLLTLSRHELLDGPPVGNNILFMSMNLEESIPTNSLLDYYVRRDLKRFIIQKAPHLLWLVPLIVVVLIRNALALDWDAIVRTIWDIVKKSLE